METFPLIIKEKWDGRQENFPEDTFCTRKQALSLWQTQLPRRSLVENCKDRGPKQCRQSMIPSAEERTAYGPERGSWISSLKMTGCQFMCLSRFHDRWHISTRPYLRMDRSWAQTLVWNLALDDISPHTGFGKVCAASLCELLHNPSGARAVVAKRERQCWKCI
jgi:hypothetical protein